ncbi:SDR family NAD(P)-dependent oxidoreductase [Pendulispora albinea]|uniref:SDR family oxidoreductase n=1 Tax=Pendulispora albinea TaxID=2741071 RepID=A0ABZ2LPM7_9BACT
MTLFDRDSQRLAVVTGASSGIGEELARGLARRGHSLVLVARRAERLEALARELSGAHSVRVEVRGCDLADRPARASLFAELEGREVDVLCHSAGFATFGRVGTLDVHREREQVELNAVAVHDLTLAVLPGMRARRRGAILVVGSTAGHQPMPGSATYSASKAFANCFAEALHEELRGTGVTCTLLAPGPVRTGFAEVAGVKHLEGKGGDFAWLGAARVAEEALRAMAARRRVVVPGAFAKLETLGGRYTPRALLLPAIAKVLERARS